MSGDKAYRFRFQPGHSTPPTSLFDMTEAVVEPPEAIQVVLFSGGLDSLTGVMELATQSQNPICLVSHESQPGTVRTQRQLHQALIARYGARIQRYGFACTLHDKRASDETQRTRMFLYGSIAAALAYSFSRSEFFLFENGITALNFPIRQDLINARATRTTHPKTLRLL
jgi:hypothetical protein